MTLETYRGVVRNGIVVLNPSDSSLRDGTEVVVTPVAIEQPVSSQRKESLTKLIGIWKSDSLPTDAEVEKILQESRHEKYG